MSARLDLPDFITEPIIQAAHRRAQYAQRVNHTRPSSRLDDWMLRGIRAAVDRDGRVLLFLQHAAEHLRVLNDAQQDRLVEAGYRRQEYADFSQWRNAYEVADAGQWGDGVGKRGCQHNVFGWIYGAAYEAAHRGAVRHDASWGY